MATRAATRAAAQGRVTRSGRVPQELIDAELTKALSIKDRRLGSIGPSVNVQEARRRLGDPETAAGLPGTNLCRYAGDDAKVAGKRPSYFNEKTIGRYGMQLCGKNIAEAWSDPEFLQQQKLVCGEKKEWVFPYKRGGKTVKGHCRNLHARRPRAKKVKREADPRQKELNRLIRERDATSNMAQYAKLDRQIKELRAAMKPKREPIVTEPDDISQFDFTVVRPNNQPRKPPSNRRPVAGTRRAPTVITGSMQAFIDSLPRGEQGKAKNIMTAYRNFGGLEPSEAIARYKQRREDDARTPLDNAGDFEDELNTDDESDDDFGGGALGPGLQNLLENVEFQRDHPVLADRLRVRAGDAGITRAQEIAQRVATLVASGMTEQAATTQERNERDQIAQLANDSYNVAMAQINQVAMPAAIASGRIMHQRDVDDAPDSPGGAGMGIPEGFHRMPDGTIMADSEHLVGAGYLIV